MNFKDIYNPSKVYDGFFESYFIRPFVHQYFNFGGHESASSLFKSLLAWLILTLGIAGIMMGQIGLIGPETGKEMLGIVMCVWGALSVIPILALLSRAAHGAPKRPIKGRMLGVDTLLGVSCLLFFLLGLMMMITTLNSGSLNPNATMTNEEDTTTIEEEYVTEEPIFTYQDEAPAKTTHTVDSLSDLNDPDAVDPDESFDPDLAAPAPTSADTTQYY